MARRGSDRGGGGTAGWGASDQLVTDRAVKDRSPFANGRPVASGWVGEGRERSVSRPVGQGSNGRSVFGLEGRAGERAGRRLVLTKAPVKRRGPGHRGGRTVRVQVGRAGG